MGLALVETYKSVSPPLCENGNRDILPSTRCRSLHRQPLQRCGDCSGQNAQHSCCLLHRQTVQSWQSRCPCLPAMGAARQVQLRCSLQRPWPKAARWPPSPSLPSSMLQRSRRGCSHPLPTALPTSQGMRACQSTEVDAAKLHLALTQEQSTQGDIVSWTSFCSSCCSDLGHVV